MANTRISVPTSSAMYAASPRSCTGGTSLELSIAPRGGMRGGGSLPIAAGVVVGLKPLGVLDHGQGVLARAPADNLDRLALEVLVDGEEVRDLPLELLRDVLQRLAVIPPRVVGRHADDLVVLPLLVAH